MSGSQEIVNKTEVNMKRRKFVKTLPAAAIIAGSAAGYSLEESGSKDLQTDRSAFTGKRWR